MNEESANEKMSYFIAVGWDKTLHIWQDEHEESETICVMKDLPKRDLASTQQAHNDDIMSCCFDVKTNLIFTGGHDGTLLAWHFETGFIKFYLHEYDSTCTSNDYIRDSKSVDCLMILKERRLLVSGTADQYVRFWDLKDLASGS